MDGNDKTPPSAAEVIAAAEKALTDSLGVIQVLSGACQMAGVPPRVFAGHGTPARVALGLIEKWKEGRG